MSAPVPLSIQEAAARLGVSPHTLRYYDREGLLDVPRASGGERRYSERELTLLRFLLHLRGTGMGMAGLRAYMALVREGEHTAPERRALLVAHEHEVEARLIELQADLGAIRAKIARYDAHLGCDGAPARPVLDGPVLAAQRTAPPEVNA
ncbi:MerR family transcriptional regulator [Deinococcus sp. PEB2-63]